MKCSNCHAEISGTAKFCPECGARVEHMSYGGNDETQSSMNPVNGGAYSGWQQSSMEPQNGYGSYNQYENTKPPKPKLPKAIIAAVLVVAVLVGAFAVFGGGSTGSDVDINSISAYVGDWEATDGDIFSIYEEQGGITVAYRVDDDDPLAGILNMDWHYDSYEIYPAGKQSYLKLKGEYRDKMFMLLSPNVLVEVRECSEEYVDKYYTTVIDGTVYNVTGMDVDMFMRSGTESKQWPLRTSPGSQVTDYKYYPQDQLLIAEIHSDKIFGGQSTITFYIKNSNTYYQLRYVAPQKAEAPREALFEHYQQIKKNFVMFATQNGIDLY